MESFDNRSDAEIRTALIAAARALTAGQGKFSLKQVLAESGVDRDAFNRCFASKEDLLTAIVSADVQTLTQMTLGQGAAQPVEQQVELQLVQGGGSSIPAAAPPSPAVDAWLERRLRVFERALSALETRQEKAERDILRNVALLEEKLAAAPAGAHAAEPLAEPAPPQPENLIMRAAALAPRVMPTATLYAPTATVPPAEPEPVLAAPDDAVFTPLPEAVAIVEPTLAEPQPVEAALHESATNEAAAEPVVAPDEPVVESPPMETTSVEPEASSEPQVESFIAHARVAAQRAAQQQKKEPARGLSLPRWVAWTGVGAVAVLLCAGLVLGTVARATQSNPPAGMVYREQPHDALGRMTALADSGDAKAQTLLALAYLRGQYGAARNDAAAIRWGLAAAQQGEPVALYMLGTLYSKDDAARAFSWFEQAALRGNIKAMHNLAIAYAQGLGTAEDDNRAAAWFNRAANQGYVDSQFDLAVLFERGQGVTQNRVAALKWYLIAARGGDAPSKMRAEQLRAEMPPEEAVRAEQLVAAWQPQPRDVAANAVSAP